MPGRSKVKITNKKKLVKMHRLPNGDFICELKHIHIFIEADEEFDEIEDFWQELAEEIEDENVLVEFNDLSVDLLNEDVEKEETRWRLVGHNTNIRGFGLGESTFYRNQKKKRMTQEVLVSTKSNILNYCFRTTTSRIHFIIE